jgi:peroxiredoxin
MRLEQRLRTTARKTQPNFIFNQTMKTKLALILALVLVILFSSGCGCQLFLRDLINRGDQSQEQEAKTEEAIKEATDPQMETIGGGEMRLSDYTGKKIIVLVFGSTWCPACQKELPEVQDYYRNADKSKVEVIWLYYNEKESDIKSFRNKHGITFITANDAKGFYYNNYSIEGIPAMVILDKKSKVVEQRSGFVSAEDLNTSVNSWINQ